MSDLAIDAQDLAKQYFLGVREPYSTLRESVVRSFRGLANRMTGRRPMQAEVLWALRDLSFRVRHGEVVGIIGRNGAGKSTLLKLLARITTPTKGHADIRGRLGSLLEVGTGFHPELTGRENVFLSGAILGMSRRDIRRKFDEIVAFAEVPRFLDTPVKHYSSGMYMRLAFAVAAHLEPDILVVDEVLAVGDLRFQTKCLDKMKDVSRTGRTVLFVSHSMGAIHRLCTRCLLLSEGRMVADGSPTSVISDYVAQSAAGNGEFMQDADDGKPIHLRRVALISPDGICTTEFRWDEPIRIEIEYDVNEPIVECTVWTGMFTAEEVSVFSTSDTDLDPGLLGVRSPGRYRTVVEIPMKWLNEGRFRVVAGIARLAARISYDRADLGLITILDVGTVERRPGILHPMLPWTNPTCAPK